MAMKFDATVKDLVQFYPADYADVLRLPEKSAFRVVNVDLSAVTAATDVVLVRGDPPLAVVDLNFQTGRDPDLLATVLVYNALLYRRFRVPVHSLIVLLRPEANDATLDDGLHYAVWPERGSVGHQVEVERLWQRPVEELLQGGVGVLPLAPLGQLPEGATLEEALPGILRRIHERLVREVPAPHVVRLWTATYLLSGLRIGPHLARPVFLGVPGMKESATYQAIVEEGRVEEAQKLILRQGTIRFGPPDAAVRTAVLAIEGLEQLERMSDRVLTASGWGDVIGTP
jgi:hypothetical protein